MAYQPPLPQEVFPILGLDHQKKYWAQIDLTACAENDLGTHDGLKNCVQSQIQAKNAKIGYGGYLEKRTIYKRSNHFTDGEELRTIHLGCDIWGPENQPIFAPLKGMVHSIAYNEKPYDYGATIIVEHTWEKGRCFALYGHLKKSDLKNMQPGETVEKGQVICHMGELPENGGWVPHLHFQLILDIEDYAGDYPGVAAVSQLDYYKQNCPDPEPWLR